MATAVALTAAATTMEMRQEAVLVGHKADIADTADAEDADAAMPLMLLMLRMLMLLVVSHKA